MSCLWCMNNEYSILAKNDEEAKKNISRLS